MENALKKMFGYCFLFSVILLNSCSILSESLTGTNSFSSTAEKVLPSIVHVQVIDQKVQKTPEGWNFSYNPFVPSPENIFEEKKEFFDEGLGSGVIIRKAGKRFFVITNRHVIADADKISIKLFSGEYVEGFVAGYDERKDIAVLYFDSEDTELKVIETGDSDILKVGDWVMAVGSPFGFDSSVTSGIISALGRKNKAGGNISDFIQTDAAINTGNSGGALVNMKGQLIGINSWITTNTGGSIGLGFAIPVNNIQKSVSDIINFGEVRYGWIGVIAGEIAEYEKNIFNTGINKGIMIFQIIKDGPADKGGLLPGDYIIKVNNVETHNVDSLLLTIGESGDGKSADLLILRDGVLVNKKVQLGLREKKDEIAGQENTYWPGITVVTINKKYMNLKEVQNIDKGVIVSYMESGSLLDNFIAGDIIIDINGISISTSRDFYREINKVQDILSIKFYRNDIEYVQSYDLKKEIRNE